MMPSLLLFFKPIGILAAETAAAAHIRHMGPFRRSFFEKRACETRAPTWVYVGHSQVVL